MKQWLSRYSISGNERQLSLRNISQLGSCGSFQKVKHTWALWSSDSNPIYPIEIKAYICKDLYMNTHNSFIFNSSKWGMTQMSIHVAIISSQITIDNIIKTPHSQQPLKIFSTFFSNYRSGLAHAYLPSSPLLSNTQLY